MKLALDTNRYVDLCRQDEEVCQNLEMAEVIYLPFVVIAELRAGFSIGQKGKQNEQILQRFLRKSDVHALYPTEITTQCYANLFRQLRRQGTPIPTNDLWIAALVVERNIILYTRDAHFSHLPQISLL